MNGALNNNIKFFRIYKGITQFELAEKIGKTKNVISNWERGDNSPDIDSVEKICVALDVTPNQLFGWERNEEFEKYRRELEEKRAKLNELRAQQADLQDQIDKLLESVKMVEVIKNEEV